MSIVKYLSTDGVKPTVSRLATAAAEKTALALCKVRLFTDALAVSGNDVTLADLDAAQADFSGYTAGGNTITAFGEEFIDFADGIPTIVAPTTQFNFVDPDPDPPVTNVIHGFYVVTAGGALKGYALFDEPITMDSDSLSIPVVVGDKFE